MFSERLAKRLAEGWPETQPRPWGGMQASKPLFSQAWWHMTVIPATQELGKEDYIHRAYLGNLITYTGPIWVI